MERVAAFDVAAARREPEPRIELLRRDTGVALILPAAALLAQYRVPSSDILLILDEDVPFEEQLHLVLVRGVDVLDHLSIGAPYASGAYREVDTDGDVLRFCFAGDEVLALTARAEGRRMPERLPSGVRRIGGWLALHYLMLQEEASR